MKVRLPLLAVVVVAVLAISCAGGDKSAASRDGQPDYEQKVVEALSSCDAALNTPPMTPSDFGKQLQRGADALSVLTPPADLVKPQRDLIAAYRKAANALEKEPTPGAATAGLPKDELATEQDFQQRFAHYYGTSLYYFEGSSMEPAFDNGDAIAVKPASAIQRWEIIVFKFPLDHTRDFIKRVVGLPGERIEVKGGSVYINGSALTDDKYALAPANYTYGPVTVPANNYVVLGDNRNNSYDSHAWHLQCTPQQPCDFVPADLILGVVSADTKGHCATSDPTPTMP